LEFQRDYMYNYRVLKTLGISNERFAENL